MKQIVRASKLVSCKKHESVAIRNQQDGEWRHRHHNLLPWCYIVLNFKMFKQCWKCFRPSFLAPDCVLWRQWRYYPGVVQSPGMQMRAPITQTATRDHPLSWAVMMTNGMTAPDTRHQVRHSCTGTAYSYQNTHMHRIAMQNMNMECECVNENSNRKSKKLLVNIAGRHDTTLIIAGSDHTILLHSSTPLLFINPPVGILANSECRQTKTNNCQRRSKWPPPPNVSPFIVEWKLVLEKVPSKGS